MKKSHMVTNILALLISIYHIHLTYSFSVSKQNLSNNNVENKIRQAMVLSNNGQQNIADAFLATSLWEEILLQPKKAKSLESDNDDVILSNQVTKICKILYAAMLTRIGRDSDAIILHDETLKLMERRSTSDSTIFLDDINDFNLWVDVKIAKGESLQRLMKYEQANKEFKQAWNSYEQLYEGDRKHLVSKLIMEKLSQCAYKAALCSMRRNDINDSKKILMLEYHRMEHAGYDQCIDVVGFLGVLQVEMSLENGETIMPSSLKNIDVARQSDMASPLYKWYHALAMKTVQGEKNINIDLPILCKEYDLCKRENLQKLSSINNSPFDDPFLVRVDDKIFLHELLSRNNSCENFWPKGYVLPDDKVIFRQNEVPSEKFNWVIKKRAGYGSHGNSIVSTNDAIRISSTLEESEKMLCQKIIQPTLCKDGRRFSLRVYVVYMPSKYSAPSIFLSSIGLMKLALAKDDPRNESDEEVNNVFMTNSGRISDGEGEAQFDFDYLSQFVEKAYGNGSYEKIWKAITSSVIQVMGFYLDKKAALCSSKQHSYDSMLSKVPKIMGFDYIIDSTLNPWLLEVNRFPGLEARGDEDLEVKTKLVKEVWKLAKANYSGDPMTIEKNGIFEELLI